MLTSTNDWHKLDDITVLTHLAIEAATTSNWQDAASINKKIIDLVKDDVDAHNRLAHAYLCQGHKDKAKSIYDKVLVLDPYNIIARKNLEKIAKMSSTATNGQIKTNMANVLVFEPGKTKVVNLLNLAPPAIIACLGCGDEVLINTKKHSVSITASDGTYLGALPDDIAHRMIGFIDGGNKYEAFVKYATVKSLTIFIREVERSAKFTNQPSFADGAKFYFEEKDIVS